MKPLLPSLLVCCAATAAPADALADMASSARLTDLRVELVDLRPDDGIAPAVQMPGMAWSQARSEWGCIGIPYTCQRASGTPFSTELSVRSEDRYSRFIATARITTTSLEATSAGYTQVAGAVGGLSRISGDPDKALPLFIMTPYTAVRITGQYALDASAGTGWYDSLIPKARVWTWGSDPGSTSVAITAAVSGPAPVRHESASGSFLATWSNPLGATRNVWGGFGVAATGVLSIPEPGTYALMGAGLGLISLVVKRRRPANG